MILKESQKVELKKSLSQLGDALKAICAFLNHKGGKIYFGVDNKGKIIGLQVTDKTLKKISQQIHSRIKPETTPEIKEINIEGKTIIEVKIPEGTNKPYFLNGIAYKRVGTENRPIPPDELKKIILEQKQTRWDEEICEKATIKDIDEKAVRDFLEKAKRERNYETQPGLKLENILEKLGLMIDNKLTNAAILFFGKNPQKFLPQAEVRCARFKGNDVTSPFIDMKIISGRLTEQIEKAEEFVLFNIKKAAWVEPGVTKRVEKFEYPPEAIREAIVNAICHRDYNSSGNVQIRIFDEKMEIWNPGTLPEGITVESLKKQHLSKPRNRSIARLLFLTKHIEQWGSGTNKMVEVCIK
ncbi:MAG: putative DNA binding domain-containing protein, partial [Candidatus Aenigmarchaeota archaeon]|nr:putative DNA binding domain-containing protein [Candidatus Aenigmarchaeota archaeon]